MGLLLEDRALRADRGAFEDGGNHRPRQLTPN